MRDTPDWKAIEREILDALDIRAEYRALGVVFASDRPTGKGWLPCHAVDRKDDKASAAVNVGNGTARGRFRDLGGEGLSVGFWEFAARFGRFGDWRAARKHFAERAGVKLPGGVEPKRPADQVDFLDTPAAGLVLEAWAGIKGGFDGQTIAENGGVYGRYPKKARAEGSQFVVCFPGHNPPALCDGEPAAWVIANTTGHPVRVWNGPSKPPTESKTISVGGSVGSLLGSYALRALAAERERADGRDATGADAPVADDGEVLLPPLADVEVVWKVEGLSDLLALHDALRREGLLGRHVVLSNSQGCLETVKPEWVALLKGKRVHIVHDADHPGQTGAKRWCQALAGIAGDVRNVVLPYAIQASHGRDLRDFLHADRKPLADLLALAETAAPWSKADGDAAAAAQAEAAQRRPGPAGLFDDVGTADPAAVLASLAAPPAAPPAALAPQDADAVLALVRLEVLGEDENGEVLVFSGANRKTASIPDAGRLSLERLVQAAGEPALQHVHDGKDRIEGKFSLKEVRLAIALRAGQARMSQQAHLGTGVWPVEGGFALVNGDRALLFDGHRLAEVAGARAGGRVLRLDGSPPWFCPERMAGYLDKARSHDWCLAAVAEAKAIMASWNWRHGAADAEAAAALAACSFIQTLWPWRPEVALSGQSDTGKTTLMKALKAMFGGLALWSDKPSEAGLRQALGNAARIILVDEFESSGHRQAILEWFRTTSQGGEVLRGTSDQKGLRFGLRHIPWIASTESGLTAEPDANRFVRLDLRKLPAGRRGRLSLPGDAALADLGLRLCAVALRHAPRAVALFGVIKGMVFEGVHGRIVECYSVPAAFLAAAEGLDEAGAGLVLGRLLAERDFGTQPTPAHVELRDALLHAVVHVAPGFSYSVAEVLRNPDVHPGAAVALLNAGIAFQADPPRRGPRPPAKGCTHAFIAVGPAKQALLARHPRWNEPTVDLAQLLARLDGARAERLRAAGSKVSGVLVPLASLDLAEPPDDAEGSVAQAEAALLFADDGLEQGEASGTETPPEAPAPAKADPKSWIPSPGSYLSAGL